MKPNTGRFCSKGCHGLAMRDSSHLIGRACITCGASFSVQPNRLGGGRSTAEYCSRACKDQGRKGKPLRSRLNAIRETIIAAYQSGKTTTEIAEQHGASANGICDLLARSGIESRKDDRLTPAGRQRLRDFPHPRMVGEQHPNWVTVPTDVIVSAYAAGESTTAIAGRLGCSQPTIIHRLTLAGVDLRKPGFPRTTDAPDGCRMQSHWERLVHAWITTHDLAHVTHPRVPWGGPQRADFLIGETYIEVWGIIRRAKYEADRTSKTAAYAASGAHLIEVWPTPIARGDFSVLDQVLQLA